MILDGLNARWHHNAIAEEKKNTVDVSLPKLETQAGGLTDL